MNTLDFIASLVASLAWPLIILVVALIFRRTIKETLSRPLRRLKAGPLEAEWDEKVAAARVEVAESPEVADAPPPSGPLVSERLREVAERSPRGAVLGAYAEIEEALRERLSEAGLAPALPMSGRRLADLAVERGIISEQAAESVRGATVLRNLAAHGPADELDARKAFDFLVLADGVMYAIEAKATRQKRSPEEPPAGSGKA